MKLEFSVLFVPVPDNALAIHNAMASIKMQPLPIGTFFVYAQQVIAFTCLLILVIMTLFNCLNSEMWLNPKIYKIEYFSLDYIGFRRLVRLGTSLNGWKGVGIVVKTAEIIVNRDLPLWGTKPNAQCPNRLKRCRATGN